ncbi:hypothetical protein A13G_02959 [Escherichia coli KTE185]|nr:hypothetical protein A13G_02959 [Escherichia coli KTE185]
MGCGCVIRSQWCSSKEALRKEIVGLPLNGSTVTEDQICAGNYGCLTLYLLPQSVKSGVVKLRQVTDAQYIEAIQTAGRQRQIMHRPALASCRLFQRAILCLGIRNPLDTIRFNVVRECLNAEMTTYNSTAMILF